MTSPNSQCWQQRLCAISSSHWCLQWFRFQYSFFKHQYLHYCFSSVLLLSSSATIYWRNTSLHLSLNLHGQIHPQFAMPQSRQLCILWYSAMFSCFHGRCLGHICRLVRISCPSRQATRRHTRKQPFNGQAREQSRSCMSLSSTRIAIYSTSHQRRIR